MIYRPFVTDAERKAVHAADRLVLIDGAPEPVAANNRTSTDHWITELPGRRSLFQALMRASQLTVDDELCEHPIPAAISVEDRRVGLTMEALRGGRQH